MNFRLINRYFSSNIRFLCADIPGVPWKGASKRPREVEKGYFYRAMRYSAKRGHAIACHSSVCPSVTLVDQDHIGWKSWKLIARAPLRVLLWLSPTVPRVVLEMHGFGDDGF